MKTTVYAILAVLMLSAALAGGATAPAYLQAFRQRVKPLGKQIPAITRMAEAVAARNLANPEMLYRYPWPKQQWFSDEFIARSGAMANWDTAFLDKAVPTHDVMLYAVRSWEEDADEARQLLPAYRKLGWLVILFASKAGMPADLPYDEFIDNGAPRGAADESTVNVAVNLVNGWLFQTELVAAFTRKGVHPGVLMSIALPGSEEFDNALAAEKTRLYPCDTPLPAGRLAGQYLRRIDWLIADVASDRVQRQLAAAADVIVARRLAGGAIKLASPDHVVSFEIMHRVKSAFAPFHVEDRGEPAFTQNTKPGDLLVWFGYIGLSTYGEDFATWIRNARVQLATCYVTDANAANNATGALAHIEQSWKLGDAEVPLPFKPDKMAPMSAVNQLLLFRLLDDAVAARLAVRH